MNTTDFIIRFVPTFTRTGARRLVFPQQGRYTWATRAEAQNVLDALLSQETNSPDSITQLYGPDPRFEVRPVRCYPGHFDPQTCWFD